MDCAGALSLGVGRHDHDRPEKERECIGARVREQDHRPSSSTKLPGVSGASRSSHAWCCRSTPRLTIRSPACAYLRVARMPRQNFSPIGRFIESKPESRSGRPCLAGTGVTVHRVVQWYNLGHSPEEIADRLGHLSLAQVHAALSYYHAKRTSARGRDRAGAGR